MIKSNINISSNIYIRRHRDLYFDKQYIEQVVGANRLKEIKNRYSGSLSSIKLNKAQDEIANGTVKCSYDKSGEISYGPVLQNGSMCWENRCENISCAYYKICSTEQNFKAISREPVPMEDTQEEDDLRQFMDMIGIRLNDDTVEFDHDKSPEISITASEPVNEQAEVKLSGIENENTDNEDISENSDKEEIPSEAPTVTSESVRSQRVCPTGENKKIISEYSMNNMVYFETLKDWRLHKGTDYAADKGQEIYSISDGLVSAVVKNELYGDGVELEYKNGFKATYYGIKPDGNISVGARIKAGDVVGTVTEIPCEKSLEAHIHLEMTKDGQYVNPETCLNNTDNP